VSRISCICFFSCWDFLLRDMPTLSSNNVGAVMMSGMLFFSISCALDMASGLLRIRSMMNVVSAIMGFLLRLWWL